MNDDLRVLVVDDDPAMANTLVDILRVKGYQAEAANSGAEALDRAKRAPWDCLLTDIKMPDMDGVELCRAMKAQYPDLCVILMTAYAQDSLVNDGLDKGALAALAKPLDLNALLSFFPALRQETSVVIVDDDPEFCRTLGDVLSQHDFAVAEVTDPNQIMPHLVENGEVVLLDMKLDGCTGLDVMKQIRRAHPLLPVILMTGCGQEMAPKIEAALQISAHTCLYKPIEMQELLRTLAEIRDLELGSLLGREPKEKGCWWIFWDSHFA